MEQPITENTRPSPCPVQPLISAHPALDAFQMMEGGLHPMRLTPDADAPQRAPAGRNAPLAIYQLVVCVPAHDAV
jgi:hypothetical protein